MTKPNPVGAATRRVLAGAIAVGLVGVAGTLGTGDATADDETAFVLGGARGPGIPWLDYTSRAGRGYYPGAERVIVPYPAGMIYGRLPDQLVPGSGLATATVGESVVAGSDNLNHAIRNDGGNAVAIGLSEGTLVLDAEQARLARDPHAPDPSRLTFALFSSPVGTHGFGRSVMGMFAPGTYIPVVDYTVPEPVDSQYDTKLVVAEYDGAADFPDGSANVLSLLNAAMGAMTVHTPAAFTTPADVPPQNIRTTVNARGATVTTYLIPTQDLPLTQPLRDMGVSDAMVDQIDAALRPEIDAGYARHTPGPPAAPAPAPVVKLNATDQANVEKAAQGITLSPTDQANIDNAVKGIKLNPTEQANLDNAVQQVTNLFPGIG